MSTSDEKKYVSAEDLAEKISELSKYNNALCPHNNRVEITSTQNWTVPDGVYSVDAFLVGGGGPGYYSYSEGGCGGSGYTKMFKNIPVTPGEVIPITIGAGGATGAQGGTTIFKNSNYSVYGGYSGTQHSGGKGGSGGGAYMYGSYGDGTSKYPETWSSGGMNGSSGVSIQSEMLNNNGFHYINGGVGQGYYTADPYSQKIYAFGGGGDYSIYPDEKGNGGSVRKAGNAGICIIYFTTPEEASTNYNQ